MLFFELAIGVILGLGCGILSNGRRSHDPASVDEYCKTPRPENDVPDISSLNDFI